MPSAPRYRRVLLKLSGEGLMGDREYGLDPNFVLAIIAVESAFQRGAISPRRALGLMQLMPETAARFGMRRVSAGAPVADARPQVAAQRLQEV